MQVLHLLGPKTVADLEKKPKVHVTVIKNSAWCICNFQNRLNVVCVCVCFCVEQAAKAKPVEEEKKKVENDECVNGELLELFLQMVQSCLILCEKWH